MNSLIQIFVSSPFLFSFLIAPTDFNDSSTQAIVQCYVRSMETIIMAENKSTKNFNKKLTTFSNLSDTEDHL